MVREIISIDEERCNGCGECVPGCPEGALQVIDGKARLVGEVLCDGLGACVGDCPTGALTVERREAEEYDEARVVKGMLPMGAATVIAHLEHLRSHREFDNVHAALDVIRQSDFDGRDEVLAHVRALHADSGPHAGGGCPGSAAREFHPAQAGTPHPAPANAASAAASGGLSPSALSHWPVQMHLINPASPHFAGSDFVLAADCTAFASGAFHSDFLAGKTLGIACPKLDTGLETYVEKVRALIDEAQINTLTVVIMQVPCCSGLVQVARAGAQQSERRVPIKQVVVSLQGDVLSQEWL